MIEGRIGSNASCPRAAMLEPERTRRFWSLFWLSLSCWVLNEVFGYGLIGQVMSLAQAALVLMLLLIGKAKSAFICHTVFVLSALEFPRDLLNGSRLYTYRTVEAFGISLSTLILFAALVPSIILSFGVRGLRNYRVTWLMLFLAVSFMIGLANAFLGGGRLGFLTADLQYYLTMLTGVIVAQTLLDRGLISTGDFGDLILSVLSSRTLVVFFGNAFGFRYGNYGGISIFSFDPLDYLYPGLLAGLFLGRRTRQERALMGISTILGIVNGTVFQASGKGFILLVVAVGLLGLGLIRRIKRLLMLMVTAMAMVFVLGVGPAFFPGDHLILRNVKLGEVFSLLNVRSLKEPSRIAASSRVRVYEFLNIADSYLREPLFAPLGKGLGGFFTDTAYPMPEVDLTAYSQQELDLRKFHAVHESLNSILLKFGLFGVFWWYFELMTQMILLALKCDEDRGPLRFVFMLSWGFFIGYSIKVAFAIGLLYAAVGKGRVRSGLSTVAETL